MKGAAAAERATGGVGGGELKAGTRGRQRPVDCKFCNNYTPSNVRGSNALRVIYHGTLYVNPHRHLNVSAACAYMQARAGAGHASQHYKALVSATCCHHVQLLEPLLCLVWQAACHCIQQLYIIYEHRPYMSIHHKGHTVISRGRGSVLTLKGWGLSGRPNRALRYHPGLPLRQG